MLTRRTFLHTSAAALAGLSLPRPAHASAAPLSAFGVQLYTARQQAIADPQHLFRAVRAIGYTCAETFGAEYTVPAKDLRSMILDAGLALPSAHFAYNDLDSKFDYARELGAPFIVSGSTPPPIANSVDGFKRAAAQYTQWGAHAHSMGMHFAFHNHNNEFQQFGSDTGLDILLRETDPKLVQWQMDCYWATQAGHDPVDLIHRYGDRLQSLHFKDRVAGAPPSTVLGKDAQHFTEVGTGTINWPAIWNAASARGVSYFFVEQDTTTIPPLESLKISFDNLKKLLA